MTWNVFDSISRIKYPGFASREEAEVFAVNAGLQQTSIYEHSDPDAIAAGLVKAGNIQLQPEVH